MVSKDRTPTLDAAAIRDSVEEERGRLMVAGTLLECVIDAEKERAPPHERPFPSLTEIARDLVHQSVRKLEAAARELDEYAEKLGVARKNEVKECPPAYLH
jgi:hypothetical protein